jgi:hypothetical protein
MKLLFCVSVLADFCNFGTQSGTRCTWINDPTNPKTPDGYYRFNWWDQSGASPSANTGPSSGHGGSGIFFPTIHLFILSVIY